MPINGSENKSVSTNTTSSTSNVNSIKINEITSTIGNSLNNIANSAIENYDLDEPELSKEGTLSRDDLDFSRIGATAGNVKDENFVNVKNPEYWGDTGDLTYKIRDDGTVAISEDGVILGFTDLQGIRIKEADSSKEEQIITEETSNVTSEKETEEVRENIQDLEETEDTTAQTVEQKEEVQVEPVEEIKEESQDVSVETLDETPIEPAVEVQEDIVIEPQVEQPVEQQAEVVAPPIEPSSEQSANVVSIPGDLKQTGICRNNTPYSHYYNKWTPGTNQRIVADMWNEAGRTNDRGIATLNGRYLVATTTTFGLAGDIIDVVLRDGTVIPCIIADAKGAGPTNTYGHVLGGGGTDVIEWEAYGSKEDIDLGEWENKGVSEIRNIGSIFPN